MQHLTCLVSWELLGGGKNHPLFSWIVVQYIKKKKKVLTIDLQHLRDALSMMHRLVTKAETSYKLLQ